MPVIYRILSLRVTCAVVAASLAACQSAPPPTEIELSRQPTTEVTVIPFEDVQAPEPVQPESTYSKGELINAAQLWLDQAQFAPVPEQQDLLLRSVAALISAGQLDASSQILNGIEVTGLSVEYEQRKRLLRARLALAEGRADRTLRYLRTYKRMQDPALRAHALALRGQALIMTNETARALRTYIEREDFLDNIPDIEQNRERIWALLGSLNAIELQIERQTADENTALADWVDLALLYSDFGTDPHRLQQTVSEWAQINPVGNAQSFAVSMLKVASPVLNTEATPIQQIALLLPLASKFGAAAQSVHDGFMAMRTLDGSTSKPSVIVYDVGDIPELAKSYYQLAIDEGADLIVGPLGKQAASAIVDAHSSQVPTLLLGGIQSGRSLPIGTYQIDLAPEHEAAQVAKRAYLDGHRVAGILRPNTDWGERVARAFVQRWEDSGGIVADVQTYEETANDQSFAVQEVLNISGSKGRKSALSALVGSKLHFQPRRRQDLDMLFLAAQPVVGRLIKPQINFFQAHDIPVYSTSHIYSGIPDPVNDTDLNQIVFPDMPWLLRDDNRAKLLRAAVQPKKRSDTNLERLFALGMDAYILARVIPYLEPETTLELKGVTAERLNISKDRHIERELAWARFQDGEPLILRHTEGTVPYENIQPDQIEQISPPFGARSASGTFSPSISD